MDDRFLIAVPFALDLFGLDIACDMFPDSYYELLEQLDGEYE